MGGSSKKVTVGYKYYLGMHMVLCHGPADFVFQIKVDDREAWRGFNNGDTPIQIDKPGLFGGEDREGGIQGRVDMEFGKPTQGQNGYLVSRLGNDVPAFRGILCAVLRQVYVGINPYVKPWSFRVQRINRTSDDQEQWYVAKAPIGDISDVAIYLAIDISNSMSTITSNGEDRLTNLKSALTTALGPLTGLPDNSSVDFRVQAFAGSAVSITRRGANGQDVQDIIDWVNARDFSDVSNGQTIWTVAMGGATSFFNGAGNKKPLSIFITDGEPFISGATEQQTLDDVIAASNDLFSTSGVEAYGINIDLAETSFTAYLDNTPDDGVPIVPGGNSEQLTNTIVNAIFSHFDMNPAHIIRECLTDRNWGMGYLDADIDDTSFMAAADTLFSEGMGISLLWDQQMPIEDFVSEIIRHINATLYVDRITGKFTLKLIRDDYDPETILLLDESNIAKVSEYNRIDPGEAINSVSVVYWDYKTGNKASVLVDNPALIQAYGNVINTTIQYPGFTKPGIAARAANRDLQTFSFPLLSATIEANREASSLNIGDVFKFAWPRYQDGEVIMRVHDLALGDGKNNRVKITATEDVFSLGAEPVIQIDEPEWVEPGQPPAPAPEEIVEEAPYFEIVQLIGQTNIDSLLDTDPDIGFLVAAATRPDESVNASIWVDAGGGYQDSAALDYSPNAKLGAAVNRTETAWTMTDMEDLEEVEVGQHGQIDQELFRVDAIDPDLGTLTVGRAILDSLPEPHSAGAPIVFWDNYASTDSTEYVLGESLNVKILPNTSQGALDIADAAANVVTMNARAFRPYRPANVQANGLLDPDEDFYPEYPVDITWVERNRLQETSGVFLDWEDATVTPEPGTQYLVTVEALDDNLVSQAVITTVTQTALTYQVTEALIGSTFAGFPFIRVSIATQRDGYDSYRSSYITFRGPFREPRYLEAVYMPAQAPVVEAIVTQ